jgi:hypothetical protein
MLALLPAAVVGHWTSDQTGYLIGNVSFEVLGAVNAVLVLVVARRLGLRVAPALAGALLYAAWFAPVVAEYAGRLEPLGNFFLLLALLALVPAADRVEPARAGHRYLLAGALLCTAASVKIWFVVPMVVAAAWLFAVQRQRRPAVLVAIGAVVAATVLDVPFLIASRGEMWTMTVTAQLTREASAPPFVVRLLDLTAAYPPQAKSAHGGEVIAAVLGTAVLIALLALAWQVRSARLVVAVAVGTIITLLLSPSWFEWYPDFAAPVVAISTAAALHRLPGRLRTLGWAPVAGAAAVTVTVLVQGSYPATVGWGPERVTDVARSARCVTSDTPAGLIALDVLDKDLRNGCAVWVDAVGRAYVDSHAAGLTLETNPVWQRKVLAYLRTGDMAYPYMFRRPLDAHTLAVLRRGGVVLRIKWPGRPPFVLYRIRHGG